MSADHGNHSSEITSKIRSAIKAKLTELGAYVDEELPDYIMVMIANKKSKQQMNEDLNLFLGKNSNIFTDWLQSVLDRLQSISRSSTSTSTSTTNVATQQTVAQVVSQSVTENAMAQREKTPTSISSSKRKRKRSTERKKKTSPTRRAARREEKEKHHQRRNEIKKGKESSPELDEKDGKKKTDRSIGRAVDRIDRSKIDRPSDRLAGNRAEEEKSNKAIDLAKATAARLQKANNTEDDILIVKADVEEGDELAPELGRIMSKENRKVINSINRQPSSEQPPRTVSIGENISSLPVATVSSMSNVRKPIEAPSSSASSYGNRRHVNTVKPMKRRTPSPTEAPSRKRRSTIGQVIHRLDDVLNEEYDPLRPQMGGSSSNVVSSTIRVTERKYTVPREMQPKPSIFLRALNEANRSVKIQTRKRDDDDGGEEHEESLESNRQNSSTATKNADESTTSERSVFERVTHDTRLAKRDEASNKKLSDVLSRRVQLRHSQKQPESIESDLIISDDRNGADKSIVDSNPRFVVTMTGVDRKFAERLIVGDSQKSDKKDDDEYDDLDTLIVDIDEEEMREEAMMSYSGSNKSTPVHTSGVGTMGQGPTPQTQIVNPIKISLDDDEDDDDMDLNRIDTVVVSDSLAGTNDSGTGSPRVIDDASLMFNSERVPASSMVSGKIMERCRYWPSCNLGSLCQYQHPTTSCKNFPQCRFGDKCLYIHPPCKFDTFCKNSRCPFDHSRAAPPPPRFAVAAVQQQNPNSFIPCKFGGRCLNLSCPYRHPQAFQPCMYGSACTKLKCAYSHRPVVSNAPFSPTGYNQPLFQAQRSVITQRPTTTGSAKTDSTKFRWVAPQTTQPLVIALNESSLSISGGSTEMQNKAIAANDNV